jgi:hypothetical protein
MTDRRAGISQALASFDTQGFNEQGVSPHAHGAETPVSIVTLSYSFPWVGPAMLNVDT